MTDKHKDKLQRRSIQLLGFGFAITLTIVKLFDGTNEIDWWVIFGFFGAGTSGTIDLDFTRYKK